MVNVGIYTSFMDIVSPHFVEGLVVLNPHDRLMQGRHKAVSYKAFEYHGSAVLDTHSNNKMGP